MGLSLSLPFEGSRSSGAGPRPEGAWEPDARHTCCLPRGLLPTPPTPPTPRQGPMWCGLWFTVVRRPRPTQQGADDSHTCSASLGHIPLWTQTLCSDLGWPAPEPALALPTCGGGEGGDPSRKPCQSRAVDYRGEQGDRAAFRALKSTTAGCEDEEPSYFSQ